MHEAELILYDGARNKLGQMGLSPEQINIKVIQGNLASITEERSQLKEAMLSITKETKEMEKKLNLIQQYLECGSKNQGIKKRTSDIQL